MAIWFRLVRLVMAINIHSWARAQELVIVPVAIPAIIPAAITFALAPDRGYFPEEGSTHARFSFHRWASYDDVLDLRHPKRRSFYAY